MRRVLSTDGGRQRRCGRGGGRGRIEGVTGAHAASFKLYLLTLMPQRGSK